jgi:protein-S-isoprenylcysteine O-methyltransferase Ste14
MLDELPGMGANLSDLVKHVLVVVAAGAVHEVVRGLALRPEAARNGIARRAFAVGGVLTLLVALFIVAPVHDRPLPGFTVAATGEPALLAYWAVYLLFLGAALVSIAGLTWRSVKTFPADPLRAGMAWMGLGAAIGLAYCAHKAIYLVASTVTEGAWPHPETTERVQAALLAGTLLTFVVGVLWPRAAQWSGIRHLIAGRAHRRLHPLWQAYYEAEPAIALDASTEPDTLGRPSLRDVEMQLYRRVIEIRDGMLAVRAFAHPRSRELAFREARKAGFKNPDLMGEAAWLELARRAKLRGSTAHEDSMPATSGGKDLPSEIRVLTEIARSQTAIHAVADRVEAIIETRTAA